MFVQSEDPNRTSSPPSKISFSWQYYFKGLLDYILWWYIHV